MTTQHINKAIISCFLEEAFENFNGQVMDALIAEDFHSYAWEIYGIPDGPEGVRQLIAFMRASFSKPEVYIEDMIAEGDKVVAHYRFEADHTGELMGIQPTGKRISIPGILIARIRHGKLAAYWRQEDIFGVMQQLQTAERQHA